MTQAAPVVVPDFTGTVITPDHPAYDTARTVFNAMVDRRPAVIARCNKAADVAAEVRYARANQLEISVYGGGLVGTGAGGLGGVVCVVVSGLRSIGVELARRVGPGGAGAARG